MNAMAMARGQRPRRAVRCRPAGSAGTTPAHLLALVLLIGGVAGPLTRAQASGEAGAAAPHVHIASSAGSGKFLLAPGARPAWSPDGGQIVFQRDGNLYVTDVAGSYEAWLTTGAEPAWSPDGLSIAYTGDEGIEVLHLYGFASRVLVHHDFLARRPREQGGTYAPWDMGVGKPSWSPDGKQLAFEHRGDGDTRPAQVWLVSASGSSVQRLTPTTGFQYAESDPAWSPDSSSLALWSYGWGLATVDLADRSPSTVYFNFPWIAYGTDPDWSPDGHSIAFTAGYRTTPWEHGIYLVDREGGAPHLFEWMAREPAWSPDGKRIAFTQDVAGQDSGPPAGDTHPDSIYNRASAHDYPAEAFSRYLFYADGRFELQYMIPEVGVVAYPGRFFTQDSWAKLAFDDDTRWKADGRFSSDGSTFEVAYNLVMALSDFEDGIYLMGAPDVEGPVKTPDEPLGPPRKRLPCPPYCKVGNEFNGLGIRRK